MAEKRPTGEEMRQKMKEEFKQDLRKRKEFLDSVKEYKRTKTLSDAVVNIQSGAEDDTDVWIEKVNEKTALSEAKMEMALDSSSIDTPSPKQEISAATEAEMRKIQAQELVRQMKAEMEGTTTPKTPPVEPKVETPAPDNKAVDTPPANVDDRPARKMMEDI
ncbi:MAG: hypothetical protein RLZZ519_3080 [Bacteroidota bacterium]|jgi:hypothetical protein